MNILVVDDDARIVEVIRIGLQNKGHRVLVAYSAQQVLDQLSHGGQRIDLVITDYLMPGMSGLALLAAIRGMHPSLPVIVITGSAETGLATEALKNGCNGFLAKPFSPDQLRVEIERIKPHLLHNPKSNVLHHPSPLSRTP